MLNNMKTLNKNNNNRSDALKWWESQLGNKYQIMIIHKDKILNGEDRLPASLTGREIEILYKAEA